MWQWALLPVCFAAFGTVGVWTVFFMAVKNGSVNLTMGFPFISQCGSYPPQSCLFSQICNTSSVLGLWIMVIRFQQIRDYGHHGKVNTVSLVLGFFACVGLSVLGNFQETLFMGVHLTGALLAFLLGLVYFWLQLYFTYRMEPSVDRCWVGPARATCCSLATILLITWAVVFKYGFRSAAAVCEWIVTMLIFGLFCLCAADFRHIECHRLTVQKRALRNPGGLASVQTNVHVSNPVA